MAFTLDMCGCRTASTGSGVVVLGERLDWADTEFLTFAEHPDAVDGQTYAIHLQDGRGWERVPMQYDRTANTLTRAGGSLSMQADGSLSTTPLNLSGNAYVTVVARSADQATYTQLQAMVAAAQASAADADGDATASAASAAAAAASAAAADPTPRILRAGDTMTGALNLKRVTVASHATAADIWSAGNEIDFTGTVTITNFPAAPAAGASRRLFCAGACAFTNNANIAVQGAANFTAAAGDIVTIDAITTTTFRATIQKASGAAVYVAPPGWQVITSGSFGTATSLVLTSLPQNFTALMVDGAGVSHNNAGGVALQVACSVNNGSAYGANAEIVATYAGAGAKDFILLFERYTADRGAITCTAATPPTSPDAAVGTVAGVKTAHTGGCNAIKFTAGGNNFDAGTYVLLGRL